MRNVTILYLPVNATGVEEVHKLIYVFSNYVPTSAPSQ